MTLPGFLPDRESFDSLRDAFAPIVRAKRPGDTVRAWVAGCAAGEEAYSVAMLLADLVRERGNDVGIKVFATDISDVAMDVARRGIYHRAALKDVPPDWREQYFSLQGEYLQVHKHLREMLVIARQDVTVDPPLVRMDLVTCRNLLIYLVPDVQAKALRSLHIALKPNGLLFLGRSDNVPTDTDLFTAVNAPSKIYMKSGTSRRAAIGSPRRTSHDARLVPLFGQAMEDRDRARGSAAALNVVPLVRQAMEDLLGSLAQAMIVVGTDGRIVLANAETERIFGYDSGELLGAELENLLPLRFRDDHKRYRSDFFLGPASGPMVRDDRRLLMGLRRDGSEFPVWVRLGPVQIGPLRYVAATISDRGPDSRRQAVDRLAATVQSSDDAIISMTTDGVMEICNPGAERLFDRSAAWLVGKPVRSLMPAESQEALAAACNQIRQGRRVERRDMEILRRDGQVVAVSVNIFALRDDEDELVGYSMIARDITEVVEMRRELENLARWDQLTGLSSRAETLMRLKGALKCERSPGLEFGILFCDVDNFKTVNDTWGHAAGDVTLGTLAARIRECVRHEDTVGRMGGDEIVVLLPRIHSLDELGSLAEKIRCRAAEPIRHGDTAFNVTVSIGATLVIPGESERTAIARADLAMYESKQAGRNRVTCI